MVLRLCSVKRDFDLMVRQAEEKSIFFADRVTKT